MYCVFRTVAILLALSSAFDFAAAAKKDAAVPTQKAGAGAAATAIDSSKLNPSSTKHSEPVIEDVTAKQLEKVLNEKDYVAVFWCKC